MFRNMAAIILGVFIGIMLSNLLGSGLVFIESKTGFEIARLYFSRGINIISEIVIIVTTVTLYWKYL